MVTLTARCPYCQQTFQTPLHVGQPVVCSLCQATLVEDCPDLDCPNTSMHCLACPSHELFVRKDFPQRLGVGIVVTGFAASTVAWFFHRVLLSFAMLFLTALIDVILYFVMGNVLECYRCHAQYRGLASLDGQQAFDLEVHEKHRQQAARLQESAQTTSPDRPPDEPRSATPP